MKQLVYLYSNLKYSVTHSDTNYSKLKSICSTTSMQSITLWQRLQYLKYCKTMLYTQSLIEIFHTCTERQEMSIFEGGPPTLHFEFTSHSLYNSSRQKNLNFYWSLIFNCNYYNIYLYCFQVILQYTTIMYSGSLV